ncbi:MAG: hypothetical protein HWE39_07910 [Oceanospirillaceae bacterium]|nr:hypothetical protein [Oceanospirillaceae bacterium]
MPKAGRLCTSKNAPPGPSVADKRITLKLRDALNMVNVRTLDHVVVSAEGNVSLAERGLF